MSGNVYPGKKGVRPPEPWPDPPPAPPNRVVRQPHLERGQKMTKTPDTLTLGDLRAKRDELEQKIHRDVAARLQEFVKATGCHPTSVELHLHEVQAVGERPQKLLGQVRVGLGDI